MGRLLEGPAIWIILILIILLFGAPKLPGLAKSLGQSMKIFKKEVSDLNKDDEKAETEVQVTSDDVKKG